MLQRQREKGKGLKSIEVSLKFGDREPRFWVSCMTSVLGSSEQASDRDLRELAARAMRYNKAARKHGDASALNQHLLSSASQGLKSMTTHVELRQTVMPDSCGIRRGCKGRTHRMAPTLHRDAAGRHHVSALNIPISLG